MLNTAEFSGNSLDKHKFKLTSAPYSGKPEVFTLTFDNEQKVTSTNKYLNGKTWKLIGDKYIQIGDCHLKGGEFEHILHGQLFVEEINSEVERSFMLQFKLEYDGVKNK